LKESFIQKLVLVVLDSDKKMRMEVGTVNYVTEEMLFIKYKDG